jgi:hypothetical protein
MLSWHIAHVGTQRRHTPIGFAGLKARQDIAFASGLNCATTGTHSQH